MRGSTTGSVMAVLLVVPHVPVVAVVPSEGDDEEEGEGEDEQVGHAKMDSKGRVSALGNSK